MYTRTTTTTTQLTILLMLLLFEEYVTDMPSNWFVYSITYQFFVSDSNERRREVVSFGKQPLKDSACFFQGQHLS
jgi:hypothetical protein